jgi:hypothetical protein
MFVAFGGAKLVETDEGRSLRVVDRRVLLPDDEGPENADVIPVAIVIQDRRADDG